MTPTPERVRELLYERLPNIKIHADQSAVEWCTVLRDTAAILADWLELRALLDKSLPAFIAGATACRDYGWNGSAAVLRALADRSQT